MKKIQAIKFENIKTTASYFLKDIPNIIWNDDLLKQIVDICNQDKVYNILFSFKFNKRKYSLDDAKKFVDNGIRGWEENKFFNFVIVDQDDVICGALEIKTSDKSIAEIGYWADENHKGIMTPAVGILVKLARQDGYQGLYAKVRVNNQGSQRVLLNNGFKLSGMMPLESDKIERYRYELNF
jgi:RimJ/RimL family protein N-acetyltransferase